MIERIYISEIQNKLKYRDRRSARRWIRINNLRLLTDPGSNRQFAVKEEFEKAMDKNCFLNPEAIASTMRFFSIYQTGKGKKGSNYKPQGEYEKEFLSILQTLNAKV